MGRRAGKGMHSRLYTRVLNQYGWVHNCSAISSLYNDQGIFGIFISPESTKVAEAVAVAINELQVRLCFPTPSLVLLLYLLILST